MKNTDTYHKPDLGLIIILFSIVVIGIVTLSSAGTAVGFQHFDDPFYYFKHQLLNGFLPGIIFFYLMAKIDYRIWKKFAFWALLISILLLISVFIPGIGQSYGKAKSWINVLGVSFQPSEFVKLTFLLYLATWLEKRGEKVKDFAYGFLPFVIVLGLVMLLMILQPDVGTMTIIVLMSLTVYFVAGAPFKHLAILGIAGVGLFALLIKVAPYRAARFTTFLHPELDPQGIGYHINQAFLALGSGGLFGLGLGHSRQKFEYLPEVTGDSIFAVIGEELGFVFCVFLIVLFLFFMLKGYKIAEKAPDDFGKFVGIGVVSWFVFQAFINMGAMVGLMPITGIPLPFISYGGTALAVALAAFGILVNISKQTKLDDKREGYGKYSKYK